MIFEFPCVIIPDVKHGAFSDYIIFKELPLYKNNKQRINLEAVVGTADGFTVMKQINLCIACFFRGCLKKA